MDDPNRSHFPTDEDMRKHNAAMRSGLDEMATSHKAEYWMAVTQQLVDAAERSGFIVTIERVSVEPLAMRNHVAKIEVREKR